LSSSSSEIVTARPLDFTASNHHYIAILLPRARGEPLHSQLSPAHHRERSGAAAAKTMPGTTKAVPGPPFTITSNHEHTLEHDTALRSYNNAGTLPS
jgi:hypothetical protein